MFSPPAVVVVTAPIETSSDEGRPKAVDGARADSRGAESRRRHPEEQRRAISRCPARNVGRSQSQLVENARRRPGEKNKKTAGAFAARDNILRHPSVSRLSTSWSWSRTSRSGPPNECASHHQRIKANLLCVQRHFASTTSASTAVARGGTPRRRHRYPGDGSRPRWIIGRRESPAPLGRRGAIRVSNDHQRTTPPQSIRPLWCKRNITDLPASGAPAPRPPPRSTAGRITLSLVFSPTGLKAHPACARKSIWRSKQTVQDSLSRGRTTKKNNRGPKEAVGFRRSRTGRAWEWAESIGGARSPSGPAGWGRNLEQRSPPGAAAAGLAGTAVAPAIKAWSTGARN